MPDLTPNDTLSTPGMGPPTSSEAPPVRRQSSVLLSGRFLRGQGLAAILLGLGLYFWQTSPYFMRGDNLLLIGSTGSALGIMAIAQTYLVISGGIDLSVGSTVSLTGIVIGLLYGGGANIWLSALAGIGMGLGIGLANGFLAVICRINPLIVTLGTLSIFAGISTLLISGPITVSNSGFNYLGSGKIGPLPFQLLLFAGLAASAYFVQRFTSIGRTIYAIGGNPAAARLSGLRVERTQFLLYVMSGLSASVAGVVITSQLNGASDIVGQSFLLVVISAVFLGGASLAGGIGGIVGTVIAVFILQTLENGVALKGYSTGVSTTLVGIVLVLAVFVDQLTRRRSPR